MIQETHGALVRRLALESHHFDQSGADAERNCWLVVHRHTHGVLPSEYDIREVPEDLYLAVLAERRCGGSDHDDQSPPMKKGG